MPDPLPWQLTREAWSDRMSARPGVAALAWQRTVEAAWRAGRIQIDAPGLSESELINGRFETGAREWIRILELERDREAAQAILRGQPRIAPRPTPAPAQPWVKARRASKKRHSAYCNPRGNHIY